MTAKEKLLHEAPGWTEHDAEVALRAVEREHASSSSAPGVDEWGDLSALHRATTASTMRRLGEQERSAGHEPW